MTDEEIIDWYNENTEIRPCNEDGEKDGNWNYIHRIKVALLVDKLRAEVGHIQPEESEPVEIMEISAAGQERFVLPDGTYIMTAKDLPIELTVEKQGTTITYADGQVDDIQSPIYDHWEFTKLEEQDEPHKS